MSLVDHVRSPELVTILLLETSWGDPQLQDRGVGAETGRGGVQGAHLEPGPPEQSLQRFLYGSSRGSLVPIIQTLKCTPLERLCLITPSGFL